MIVYISIIVYFIFQPLNAMTIRRDCLFHPQLADTLKQAIEENHFQALQELFDQGMSPNSYTYYPMPLLFYAVQKKPPRNGCLSFRSWG